MTEMRFIDLQFQDQPEIIASYVLQGPGGVVIVETGPESTGDNLIAGLKDLGIDPGEISDILVTHIHLDHAGAAGWLAQLTGATVHVHEVGAPHLADPSRLLASAARIYGDLMEPMWGNMRSVAPSQLHALRDGERFQAGGLEFTAIDTPGHAYHHMAYLWQNACFTGDVAGVRLPNYHHIRLPTPPPEIDVPAWQRSLERLIDLNPDGLFLTHYGPIEDGVLEHLRGVAKQLDAYLDWMHPRWQADQSPPEITTAIQQWLTSQAIAEGCDDATAHRYEVIVPSYMQVTGLMRYLRQSAMPG